MSILDNVTTKVVNEPPRIVIYGAPKVGKSTFVSESPSPIMIDLEDGSKNINIPRISDIVTLDKFKEVITALLSDKHEYKTLIIDSVDWLERLVHKDLSTKHGKDSIEDFGYGKGYQLSCEVFDTILSALDRLRLERKMIIIFIGHDIVKKYNDPLNDSYDRHTLKLHAKAEAIVTEWSDAILYATKQVYTQKTEKGFGQKEVKAVSGNRRLLICDDTPSALAGNRYRLPKEMDLKWSELMKNITGEK